MEIEAVEFRNIGSSNLQIQTQNVIGISSPEFRRRMYRKIEMSMDFDLEKTDFNADLSEAGFQFWTWTRNLRQSIIFM